MNALPPLILFFLQDSLSVLFSVTAGMLSQHSVCHQLHAWLLNHSFGKELKSGTTGQTLSHTLSNTSLLFSPGTVHMLHHRSVNSALIWSLCVSLSRVFLQYDSFARTPAEVRESRRDGSGLGSLIRHQPRRFQTVSEHNLFHPSHQSWGILFVFLCERVQVPLMDHIREPWGGEPKSRSLLTLFKWTLDMWRGRKRERLNSSLSAIGPLRDAPAVWRGRLQGSASPLQRLCCAIELHSCKPSQALILPLLAL